MVDILASEYGWTVDTILHMSKKEILSMVDALTMRHKYQNESLENMKKNGKINKNDTLDVSKMSADDMAQAGFKFK